MHAFSEVLFLEPATLDFGDMKSKIKFSLMLMMHLLNSTFVFWINWKGSEQAEFSSASSELVQTLREYLIVLTPLLFCTLALRTTKSVDGAGHSLDELVSAHTNANVKSNISRRMSMISKASAVSNFLSLTLFYSYVIPNGGYGLDTTAQRFFLFARAITSISRYNSISMLSLVISQDVDHERSLLRKMSEKMMFGSYAMSTSPELFFKVADHQSAELSKLTERKKIEPTKKKLDELISQAIEVIFFVKCRARKLDRSIQSELYLLFTFVIVHTIVLLQELQENVLVSPQIFLSTFQLIHILIPMLSITFELNLLKKQRQLLYDCVTVIDMVSSESGKRNGEAENTSLREYSMQLLSSSKSEEITELLVDPRLMSFMVTCFTFLRNL